MMNSNGQISSNFQNHRLWLLTANTSYLV